MSRSDGPARHETIRLHGFSYGAGFSYFVTACTAAREPLLARISANGIPHESEAGRIVRAAWHAVPDRFPDVQLGAFIVMPDHIHAILTIADRTDRQDAVSPSLSRVIGVLKSISSVSINQQRARPGAPVWQRSFHDRVIRNETEFLHLWGYILDNPIRWANTQSLLTEP